MESDECTAVCCSPFFPPKLAIFDYTSSVYHHEELDLMIYNGFTYGLVSL